MIADGIFRNFEAAGDLLPRQPLLPGQAVDFFLLRRQITDRLLEQPAGLLQIDIQFRRTFSIRMALLQPRAHIVFARPFLNRVQGLVFSHDKQVAVGVFDLLQQMTRGPDFQKYILGEFFGLSLLFDDVQDEQTDFRAVAIEQRAEGRLVARADPVQQKFGGRIGRVL